MIALLIGLGLAVVIAVTAKLTEFDQDRSFYPTVLIVIASYYILFAVIAGEAIAIEIVVATAFTITAILGGLFWPMLVGIGILMHGVFDFIHPRLIHNVGVPTWWPAFCAGVDVLLGSWVIYLAHKSSTQPKKSRQGH